MKKIEAIIRPGVRDAVVTAIKKHGVGGITIQQIQGPRISRLTISWTIL